MDPVVSPKKCGEHGLSVQASVLLTLPTSSSANSSLHPSPPPLEPLADSVLVFFCLRSERVLRELRSASCIFAWRTVVVFKKLSYV